MTDAKDPRALARELGADAVVGLLRDAWHQAGKGDPDLYDLEAAARRLAEPEAVGRTRLWAWRSGGPNPRLYFGEAPTSPTDTPGLFVPLDGSAVVLTREEADDVRRSLLAHTARSESGMDDYAALALLNRTLAALDAALAAANAEGGR